MKSMKLAGFFCIATVQMIYGQSETTQNQTANSTQRYPTWREELVYNDRIETNQRNPARQGNWDYQQNWQYEPEAYLQGETQNEFYRRTHNSNAGGVGYDADEPLPNRSGVRYR